MIGPKKGERNHGFFLSSTPIVELQETDDVVGEVEATWTKNLRSSAVHMVICLMLKRWFNK